MRVRNSFLVIALYLSLPVVFSQSAPASDHPPEVLYGETSIEWRGPVPDAGLLLTVSGPKGLYVRQEHAAGSRARFSLIDEQGQLQPDGVYKWELVVQAGWEEGSQAQSGWFQIQGGRVVAEGTGDKQPVVVEVTAPQNSLYVDNQGRVGIGTSVPGAQLHLKGSDPALAIENTQAGGREYRLRSQERGDGSLGLFDQTAGKARWLVDAEGRVGINTASPTSALTVDGYIEATKGFLVNGRPVGPSAVFGGVKPLAIETDSNNFFGSGAGAANTTGYQNSFFGAQAGASNTTGNGNAFFGRYAGLYNTTGYHNSFFGTSAGASTNGQGNAFFGTSAGAWTTTGDFNCFFGRMAGEHDSVESYNTLIGAWADIDPGANPATNPVTSATAIGYKSYVSRSNSVVLGAVRGYHWADVETFVGIGTPSPDRQLVVEGSQAIGKFRRYNSTGPDFGPAFLFERARGTNTAPLNMQPGDYLGKVQFRGGVSGTMLEYGALVFIGTDPYQNGRFSFVDRDLVTERMVILNSGNVGIGTNAPTQRLDVAGNLRVRGSIFYGAPAIPVPDYVFEPDYRLMPLAQLDQYVRTKRHLPNVPKASEIQDNGVNLGEFQMKLLEKIEELTLYALQQEQANNRLREDAAAQKEEAAALRQKAASQEERIKALEEMVKALVKRDKGGR